MHIEVMHRQLLSAPAMLAVLIMVLLASPLFTGSAAYRALAFTLPISSDGIAKGVVTESEVDGPGASQRALEATHRQHIALSEPGIEPYLPNMNYSLAADGIATSSGGRDDELDVELNLDLSVWKSTATMAWMDVLNGRLRIGNEIKYFERASAYYIIDHHQFRIFAKTAGNASESLRLAIIIEDRKDLDTLDSTGVGLAVRVIGTEIAPVSGSQWHLKMEGRVSLSQPLSPFVTDSKSQVTKVTLTAILDNLGDEERFHELITAALEKLREKHPELEIEVVEKQFPYPNERTQLIDSVNNGTSIDLMSIDQIWLGELAEMGLLSDLTSYTKAWNRSSDWYLSNWDGGAYKGKTYAIWVWTDVRGMYYWKDMFEEAGVSPESLKTWDGYISSASALDQKLRPKGVQGVHLTGVGHSPDLWYPYLWMLGGEIVEQKSGHPTRGVYWYPAYNSSEGVEALTFIKEQVDAGIEPQTSHSWGKEFQERKFALMIEASHVPGYFQLEQGKELDKVGFIPMFPVPNATIQTTTLMGGWELAIPVTSQHKELAWELIDLMVDPEVLAPWLAKYNYLPTQLPIGQGPYSEALRENNPFFDQMASEIQYGRSRPSIPEYPQIADHIREAIDDVYNGRKSPQQALDSAAAKSAAALGWTK